MSLGSRRGRAGHLILNTIDRPFRCWSLRARPVAVIAYSAFRAAKRSPSSFGRPDLRTTSLVVTFRPLNRRASRSTASLSTTFAL